MGTSTPCSCYAEEATILTLVHTHSHGLRSMGLQLVVELVGVSPQKLKGVREEKDGGREGENT